MNIRYFKNKEKKIINSTVFAFLKCFITLWALSGDSLSLMLTGYSMEVPVVKYFFTLLGFLDGWSIMPISA